MDAEIIGFIISIFGAVTGISGMILGILGFKRNTQTAVNEFLAKMESSEQIEARQKVYQSTENIEITDQNASKVVNFFNHWGLLAKRKYLPMWVFDGASGVGTCRLYEKTESYIDNMRKHFDDEHYAENFSWLYHKLIKKHPEWSTKKS